MSDIVKRAVDTAHEIVNDANFKRLVTAIHSDTEYVEYRIAIALLEGWTGSFWNRT